MGPYPSVGRIESPAGDALSLSRSEVGSLRKNPREWKDPARSVRRWYKKEGPMYCICNNPVVPYGNLSIPKGKDTCETTVACPYCKRVYRIAYTLLRESPKTDQEIKDMIEMQKSK